MAKIVEEVVVIKFSKLVKDAGSEQSEITTAEVLVALEQVAQELAGEGIVVEAVKA